MLLQNDGFRYGKLGEMADARGVMFKLERENSNGKHKPFACFQKTYYLFSFLENWVPRSLRSLAEFKRDRLTNQLVVSAQQQNLGKLKNCKAKVYAYHSVRISVNNFFPRR